MRKSFASRAFGVLPFLLVVASSCSLVYDLSPDQCGNNDECVAKWGEGQVCNSGICECGNEDLCGKGGTSGTGGTDGATGGTGGDAGSGEVGGTGGTAGMSAGGASGGTAGKGGAGGASGKGGSTGGTGDDGGMGGMVEPPECAKHVDCFKKYEDSNVEPRACVAGKCVPLKSKECPVVLPRDDNGEYKQLQQTSDAIILGGFAAIPSDLFGIGTKNYDLALTEMWVGANGVYAGSQSRHQLMMVVCDPAASDLLVPAGHLINDLGVKGIVASMPPKDVQYIWEEMAAEKEVFFMLPLWADQPLTDLNDDGLIWSMLSGAKPLSVSLQPLLEMTESHLRALGTIPSPSDPLKVGLVTATDDRFLTDMGNYLKDSVTFNGELAKANPDTSFKSVAIVSAPPDADNSAPIKAIRDFAPHVIVGAFTFDQVNIIIPAIEAGWDAATSDQPRPFYLLSPDTYNADGMPNLLAADTSEDDGKVALYKRILGLGWPAAVDQDINIAYQDRYTEKYQQSAPGRENFYDAAYYLSYAVAAATQPLTGKSIAFGMTRVTSGDDTLDVGPVPQMSSYTKSLSTDSTFKFQLISAEGPPNWDPFGGRNNAGSVWCVDSAGNFNADVLRYNSTSNPATLDGEITALNCFKFPEP